MRFLKWFLLTLLLLVVIVLVGGFLIYDDTVRGPLPQTAGTLAIAGLEAQVEVLRDAAGVPHIYASTPHDLFFAQGLVQAQDRWWQMEFNRHIGRGAIEELTGYNRDLLDTDLFIRSVGWYASATLDLEALDDASRAMLEAFTDGVNAYISGRAPEDLALEYRLLGVTGVSIDIEPWTMLDSLVWGKVMAWNLTDSGANEMERAAILEAVGPEMLADYTPPFPYDDPDKPEILADSDLPLTDASLTVSAASGTVVTSSSNRLSAWAAGTLAYLGSGAAQNPGIGSNNWVAAGAMTDSGQPMLANDPHLGPGMPSIWYEIGLHCQPVTDACPYNAVGMAFPATPGIASGHNDRIAWGVTNVGADVQDMYAITVNPDNPLQYQWNGEWRDMTVREERIDFGDGGTPITIQVRITHLGPIVNDNELSEDGLPTGFNNTDPLALRWTGSDASTLLQSVRLLGLAQNWADFREALSYWDVPSQNFVYADVDGNIGYQTPGEIPIRAADHSGTLPVDGSTDAYEWRGYIPFDLLPRIYNPARGYIATANQAVTPLAYYDQLAEELGGDANYLLSYDFSYGYRGQRINQLLNELAPLGREDFAQIQGDTLNLNALEILPALASLTFEDAALTDMRDWLLAWDGSAAMDNPQMALWGYFSSHLLDRTFTDQLPPESTASTHNLYSIVMLLQDPENAWWDDATTADVVETRDDILRAAFADAVNSTTARLGSDRDQWTWGALHTVSFISNPLGLSGISVIEDLVNRGPVSVSGGPEIVNANSYSALGALETGVFNVGGHPSMRTVIDLSNWDSSQSILPTGQSGHPASPHYADQTEQWRMTQYHPMWFTRAAVENAAVDRLVLEPRQ